MNSIRIDVLIVTAVKDEWDAVLGIDTGAFPGSMWKTMPGPLGLTVAHRDFTSASGKTLRIAVTQALGMGGVDAVTASSQVIKEYQVRCLAMCGVCAGRRGEVELGDVIIADRLWQYDTGKRHVKDVDGQRVVREQGDIDMFRIHPPEWEQVAERFQIDPEAQWLKTRPRSYEAQGNWILERVLHGGKPAEDPDQGTRCPNYDKALARLWKEGLLQDGSLELTQAGRRHIERLLVLHRDHLPEPKPFRIRIGPIASGNKVMEDAEIFPLLAYSVRKVLGVEMEAAAIGALAHAANLPYSVVMKAVMDHADDDKNDNFKAFAARASAESLMAFVLQHVPPREKDWGDNFDKLLKQNEPVKEALDDSYKQAKAWRDFYGHGARWNRKLGRVFLVLGLAGALLSALLVRGADFNSQFLCWLFSGMFVLAGIHGLVDSHRDQKKKVAHEEHLGKLPREDSRPEDG